MSVGIRNTWRSKSSSSAKGLLRHVWGGSGGAASKPARYARAVHLLKQRKYSEALEAFERLVEAFPGSVRARRGRAMCRFALKDFIGAKADTERWIANLERRSETDADAYYHLGVCLLELHDRAAAVGALETALLVNPMHARALKALDSPPLA